MPPSPPQDPAPRRRLPAQDLLEESPPETVRGLLRHSWIYSLAPIIQRALSIVLIRFYTQKLDDPGQYGILVIADLLIALVPQLMGMNLLAGVTRFYFEHRNARDRAAVVTSAAVALFVVSSIVTLVLLVFRVPLAGALFAAPSDAVPGGLVDAFAISVLIVPFTLCTGSAMQYLRVLKRSRASTTIQLLKSVFEAALKLYMLFVLEWGVVGFLLSILIGEAVSATLLVGWMVARLGARFDWRVFKPLLLYSLPLIPAGLFQLLLHQADRLLLQHLGPQEVAGLGDDGTPLTLAQQWVGIYGLGYNIGFLLHSAVLASFMQIWQPHVFGLPEEHRRVEMRRVGTFALVAMTVIYLPVALFGRQAVDILAGSEAYRDAWRVVPWIVLAYLCYASYSMGQVALFAAKRTWWLLWLNLGAVVLNLSLNALWIPGWGEHGYMAATFATLVTFAAFAVGAAILAARAGWQTFELGRALALGAMMLIAAMTAYLVDSWRDPLADGMLLPVLAIKAALLGLLVLGIWFVALDRQARAGLVALVTDLVRRRTRK